jgi:hypothetical protein
MPMSATNLEKHNNIAETLLTKLGLDTKLVIKFFAMFSRTEYALKQAKYFSYPSENTGTVDAKADWCKFARELNNLYPEQIENLLQAAKYLREQPPKKQIVKQQNGEFQLTWIPSPKPKDLIDLLVLVRRVRNNLFHGGKYPEGPEEKLSRDRDLMKSCLVILEECLRLCKEAPCEETQGKRLRTVYYHFSQ